MQGFLLGNLSTLPSSIAASISFSLLVDWRTVLKLVSMPPSQRWST